jgi:hypothetical protein
MRQLEFTKDIKMKTTYVYLVSANGENIRAFFEQEQAEKFARDIDDGEDANVSVEELSIHDGE